MRKLMGGLFISLDGVVESPDQWSMDYFDEDMGAAIEAQTKLQDAVLLGRVTYEEWSAYWTTTPADQDFADFINNIPKYVVSSTLEHVEWNNSTLLKGDLVEEVTKLKNQDGKAIGVQASPTLVEWLLDHDLLDEMILAVQPVVVRSGRRLFHEGRGKKSLKLVKTSTTSSGIVILYYELDRK